MTGNVPARVPLGGATLIRDWYLDVNTGTTGSPEWTPVGGITNFQPTVTLKTQDTSDFDGGGYTSQTATAVGWGVTVTVDRKETAADATVYDPGQEALRAVSTLLGASNEAEIRFYEMTANGPRVEAYQGLVMVQWSPASGAYDAVNSVQVTMTGQGQRQNITHPASTSVLPVIASLSPATAPVAGGSEVGILGSGFTGATAVTVGGTAVATANWSLVSDGRIDVVAPAHAAGAVTVTVTTPNGTSGSANLTYS